MTQVNAQMTTAGPSSPLATNAVPNASGLSDTSYIDGQTLYLGDGTHLGNAHLFTFVHQFLALDLTTSWTTASPAWKSLDRLTAYPGDNNGPLAATPDGKSVFFFPTNGTRRYDVASGQYTKETFVELPFSFADKGITTDTDAGLIYGFGGASSTGDWNITAFDPVKNSYTYQTISDGPSVTNTMTTVYSSAKKSFFTYKSPFRTGVSQLNQYDIAAKTFTPISATGAIPSPRKTPCFASAYNGTKLIIAGGAIDNSGTRAPVNPNLALDDVYMLDVPTMVWTKMASMPSKYYGGICAVSGDSFIIWGGYNTFSGDSVVIQSNLGGPIVLDMKANSWGTVYTPSSKTSTGGNSNNNGGAGGSGNGSNSALNLSARNSIAGVLAVVAVTISIIM
ncbi:hypothetical protein EMPS_08487 [Entomortierella parvispora]|uniref:Uncharacterized protein n=1 Tax=Entomortierella parvispora TaxID=205924 RepID=A0A9P3HGS5_9FUNG|nr:hypothetical protein EMPS_08487 [Entomortierella parvispora]